MSRALTLRYRGSQPAVDLDFTLDKIDRRKLYGFVDTEALDDHGRPCELALLAGDGHSLVGRGGSALLYLDPDGNYLDRQQLAPVDSSGQPLAKVASSFAAAVDLSQRATVDELLSHNIKAAYQLTPPIGATALLDELKRGAIYTFAFSYRGGLDPDAAFLLCNPDGIPFLLLGKPTRFDFVALSEAADDDSSADDEADSDDDDVDFAMI